MAEGLLLHPGAACVGEGGCGHPGGRLGGARDVGVDGGDGGRDLGVRANAPQQPGVSPLPEVVPVHPLHPTRTSPP